MKTITKLIALVFVLILLFTHVGCSKSDDQIKATKLDNKKVLSAVDVLTKHWNKEYERMNIKDKYLEIVNTRIVNIKEDIDPEEIHDKGSMFKDIDYIVEFELISNYFGTSPYYSNAGFDNCVVVYNDGSKDVSKNLLNTYRATTFSTDFTPIIESTEEFGGKYDQVLNLE